MIAALISVAATLLVVGGGALVAHGRNQALLTALAKDVQAYAADHQRSERETRETLQRFGERIGRLETRGEVEREFSGRVPR